jgi:hypothetical protein
MIETHRQAGELHRFSLARKLRGFTAAFPRKVFGKRDRRAMGPHCGWSLRCARVRQLSYGNAKRRCSLGIARFLSPTITSTDAKFSSALGPTTASFPLGSSVIARSASFIAASFRPGPKLPPNITPFAPCDGLPPLHKIDQATMRRLGELADRRGCSVEDLIHQAIGQWIVIASIAGEARARVVCSGDQCRAKISY